MTAFDTDVLGGLFKADPLILGRPSAIPVDQQAIPIVAIEEILRGRLDAIRQAQSKRIRTTTERAYELFEESPRDIRRFNVLQYTRAAQLLFEEWRSAKIRLGSQDLRMAAVCVTRGATLVARNRRDFEQIPGLTFELWN